MPVRDVSSTERGFMIGDLIFDLGMNNGNDTHFYLNKGFRVVAVEPNPSLCEQARQRFSPEIKSGRLQIINKAIAKVTGEIEFFLNDQVTGWSTSTLEWLKARNREGAISRPVIVRAVTFQEILTEYGIPYYVKVDIQGGELLCLEALLDFSDRPRNISISSGSEAAGKHAYHHIKSGFELFSRLGYRRFKIVPQQHTELQKCPFPSREGSYVEYRFPHGSSGLFGNELPGDWMNASQAWSEYRKIIISHKFAGNTRSPDGLFRNLPSKTIKYYLDRLFWRGVEWYDTHAILDD